MKPLLAICILLFTVFLCAFTSKKETHVIVIEFKHKVGEKLLKLSEENYINAWGEPFVVNKFRYYVSRLTLIDDNSDQIELKGAYHLVDEADSTTKIITLTSSLPNITAVQFVIGIDSVKNVSGVQTGDLDPMKGMFWTWNTGYVFAKLEGTSDSSHALAHYFTYDVGGFRSKESALRKIVLPTKHSNTLSLHHLTINVDINKWFQSKHDIRIRQSPVCHQPGELAMQLADNYSTMFSVGDIN